MIKRVLSLFWVAVFVVLFFTPKVSFANSEPTIIHLTLQNITDVQLSQMVASGEIPHNTVMLHLAGNQISDISPLKHLTNLRELFLEDNQISDISPLSSLKNLELLVLSRNPISDVSPLSAMTSLEFLRLSGSLISDVLPLSNLVNLQLVDLSYTTITHRALRRLRESLPQTEVFFDWIPKSGHVLGNDHISIGDALEILRFVARLPSTICEVYGNSAFRSARIVSEDIPRIEDAIEILRYLVGLPSELDFLEELSHD